MNYNSQGRCCFTRLVTGLALAVWLMPANNAKAFKVYTRIVQKVQNSGTKDYDTKEVTDYVPYIHAWYDEKGKSSTVLLSGFGNDKKAPTKETITLKDGTTQTWYSYDYGNMASATDAQYYKVIVAAYDMDTEKKAKNCVWQSADLDVYSKDKKSNEDIYLEIEYMPAKTATKSRFSFHEETPWQAQGYNLKYYVCDNKGNHLATFQNVLNQMVYLPESTTTQEGGSTKTTYDSSKPEIMSHPDNTSLWNAVVSAKSLTKDTKFYISGGYYDNNGEYVEKYQYRPFSDYAFSSNNTFKTLNGYSDYGNCKIIDNVTTPRNDAFFTVGESNNSGNNNAADVSYTLYLNTSLLSDATSETNQDYSQYPKNQKVSVYKTIGYGNQSVTLQRNAALAEDKEGYDLLVNMVNLRPEDGYENQETNTDHWDVTGSSRTMTKLDFSNNQNELLKQTLSKYTDFYTDDDIVYHYRVPKPQTDFESLFMAFLPNSVKSTWTGSDDDWNKIIRPQVQEGKTAKGLIGGVFVPEHQAMEALTPDLPNSNYAQFDVFLNISKSMYLLVPVSSYDLTGPAVRYYNTSSHQFEESTDASHWGNGNYQYQYTPMAYNKVEKCWQYTGMFFQSINRNEDGTVGGTDNGFRIRVNQLYSTNYHEEPYWFSSQNVNETKENIVCHQNQTYKEYVNAQTEKDKTIITTRPMKDVPEWTTTTDGKTVHNPYGPDTYYYNHLVTCNTGTPLWQDAKNTKAKHGVNDNRTDGNIGQEEEQQRININFDLPSGWYTIKFYPQGDQTGKPYYTLQEAKDPGTDIPVPVNSYKYIRTYSATKAYVRPKDMDVFTVTTIDKDGMKAHLKKINELGYLPANTGLIIAYTTDISTGNTDNLEFSSDVSKEKFTDMSKNYPRLNLTEYKGTTAEESSYTKDNLLKPTTLPDGSIYVNPTTEFEDDGKTVKVRNYNFCLTTTYADNTHTTPQSCTLSFKRVRTFKAGDEVNGQTLTADDAKDWNTPPAERAYLSLPANIYGGTTYGAVSNDELGEQWNETSGAKLFNLIVDFDDTPTGITSLPATAAKPKADNTIYTLMGTRVSGKLSRGIYIKNGKKIVVR